MLYKVAIKIQDVEALENRVIEIASKEDFPQVVQNIRDEFDNKVMYIKMALTSPSS